MKFIAINTAAPIIEIAVVYDEQVSAVKLEKVMAAEQLLPTLDEMLDMLGLVLDDFDSFVCVTGPGSFTGIRIGINTVRSFAYALNKGVYGVTYDKVMAYNSSGKVVCVVEGGAGVCYVTAFDGEQVVCEPTCIYKKDLCGYLVKFSGYEVIADYAVEGATTYNADGNSLIKAACYAIANKLDANPLYIRKAQPDRKENDI